MLEKRQTIRKLVNIPMKITLSQKTETDIIPIEIEGDIKDIAINGFCLEVKIHSDKIWETLKDNSPDKVYCLHLEVPSHGHKLVVEGAVAWWRANELEQKSLKIGMFLNNMEDAVREEWYHFVEKL